MTGEVWCHKCARPAEHEVRVDLDGTIELWALCEEHWARLLRKDGAW